MINSTLQLSPHLKDKGFFLDANGVLGLNCVNSNGPGTVPIMVGKFAEEHKREWCNAGGTPQQLHVLGLPLPTGKKADEDDTEYDGPEDITPLSQYRITDTPWVVQGLIPEAGLTMWTGQPGDGKSTIASKVAHAVATGSPLCDQFATSKRPVLFLDGGENPLNVVLHRFNSVLKLNPDDLIYWGSAWSRQPTPQFPSMRSEISETRRTDSKAFDKITEWIERTETKPFVVIDSYASFFCGDDENNNTQARRFNKYLRIWTECQASLLVIHHPGKAETAQVFRGASAIKDGLDSLWKVQAIEKRLGRTRFIPEKLRMQGGDAIRDAFDVTYDERTCEFSYRSLSAEQALAQRMIQALQEHPGSTKNAFVSEVVKIPNVTRDVALNFLEVHTKAGLIERKPGPRKAQLHYWVGMKTDPNQKEAFDPAEIIPNPTDIRPVNSSDTPF